MKRGLQPGGPLDLAAARDFPFAPRPPKNGARQASLKLFGMVAFLLDSIWPVWYTIIIIISSSSSSSMIIISLFLLFCEDADGASFPGQWQPSLLDFAEGVSVCARVHGNG